mgnify:CR=1 FL=1
MKKQKWIRKGMAFVLSLAMVAGLVPAMSGGKYGAGCNRFGNGAKCVSLCHKDTVDG